MSKVVQRMGTKKQVFSYDITVHYIELALTMPVRINVVWKRRRKRIQTKNKPALSPSTGSVQVNQTLTMINTLYMDKKGKFQRKKALLTVQAIVQNRGMKKVGQLSLNIQQFYNLPLRQQIFSLQKCPDRKSKICVSVQATALGEAMISDNMSQASGYTGFSMGTQGDFQGELFQQDLEGFEQDIIRAPPVSGKPPVGRQPLLRLPEGGGPINPLKLNQALIKPKQDESGKISEYKAQLAVLQKENSQLQQEKEGLKVQLGLAIQKAKKEREGLFESMTQADSELKKAKKQIEKLKDRVARRDEAVANFKAQNESLSQYIQESEKQSQSSSDSKNKLQHQLSKCRQELVKFQDQVQRSHRNIQELEQQIQVSSRQQKRLKQQVSSHKQTIQKLKLEMLTSRETHGQPSSDANFLSYKKKTDLLSNFYLVSDYSTQLRVLENEKEEALSKQTQQMFQIQKLKKKHSQSQEQHREQMMKKERQVIQLRQDNNDLIQRVQQESQRQKAHNRQSNMMQTQQDAKFRRLTQQLQQMKTKKQQLQSQVCELEKKSQKQPESQIGLNSKLSSLQRQISDQLSASKQKDQTIQELNKSLQDLQQQNLHLKQQLRKATTSQFSDPANIILRDQISNLQDKLNTLVSSHASERSNLTEKIRVLQKQIEFISKKKREMQQQYDNQLASLNIEREMLRQQKEEVKNQSPARREAKDLAQSFQEEDLKQNLKLQQMEIQELKAKLATSQEDIKAVEKKYLDSKMGWANSDLEKESLVIKYREAQEELRGYSSEYTMMEVELHKLNQRFGQTLNDNNELEMEIQRLRVELNEAMSTGKKKKR